MSRGKKICLFGGTFDPPHIGHLLVAQTIFEAENFDKIVFIPTFKTPQKNNITDIIMKIILLVIKKKAQDVEFHTPSYAASLDPCQ